MNFLSIISSCFFACATVRAMAPMSSAYIDAARVLPYIRMAARSFCISVSIPWVAIFGNSTDIGDPWGTPLVHLKGFRVAPR